MELFTLTLMSPRKKQVKKLCHDMMHELDHLHNDSNGVNLTFKIYDTYSIVECRGCLPGFELLQSGQMVYEKVSHVIANYILEEEESRKIKEIITNDYDYNEAEEIEKIEQYCTVILDQCGDADSCGTGEKERRKLKISALIKAYLEENTHLNLNGFIQFRLHDYTEDLREVVEYAIDEFLMDKQYQEFISLLKYFVYIQEAKIPSAHLMHKGGHEFTLLNENLMPIDINEFDGFTVEILDQDINLEDMIVSTLITVSPHKIYIHTREPEVQVIKTIMNIFEDRAKLCVHCKFCQPVLGKNQNHLYP